jgi:hypothetical protein
LILATEVADANRNFNQSRVTAHTIGPIINVEQ